MDEIINKIKEVGINEISKKTFLNSQFLEAIVNKDFSIFTENRAKKVAHILKRDYALDMQPWYDEFLAYMRSNNIASSPEIGTNLIEEDEVKSSKIIYFIFALLTLLVLGYFIVNKISKSDVYDNPPLYSQNQDRSEESLAQDIFESHEEELSDEAKDNANSFVEEKEDQPVTESKEEEKKLSSAKIEVSKIWLSEYDLDSKKRSENIYSGEYDIKLDKNYVFITGHGNFTLNIDGEKTKISKAGNVAFLVKDGKVEQISLDEYKRLTKSK